eukprot:s3499_g11.t1
MFTLALARRLPPNVVIHSLHPAIAQTQEKHERFEGPQKYLFTYILQPLAKSLGFMQSEEDAPKTQIHVSTHPSVQAVSGRYYSSLSPPLVKCGKQAEDCGVASVSATASNRLLQEELFTASCELLGLTDGPSWWHIAAHSEPGGTGRLILEDEDGAPQVVSMSALFECQTPPLGVSVLACDGEQAGRALLDAGASFAIVATGQLRDSTARMFASHFYRRLHCACRGLETSNFLPEGLASRVQLAFRAAKEALKTAANAAIRADAPQLILLEKGSLPPVAPLGRSCNLWVPVAIAPETRGSAQQGVAGDVEEDPIPIPVLPVSTYSSRSLPEDCEDFLGRGSDLQRLLQQLGAPRGRRVIVLHGPCGIGKSAISAELCRFATAPGRRFAPVKGRHRLAYVSLQNSSMDSETGTEACAHLSIFAAAAGLASNGRACLLIDRAEKQFGWRDEFVPEVLDKHPQLCLLITRRSPLYRLDGEGGDRWKPVNIALGPLPDVEAAQLFLQRLHRPLFPLDLWPAAKAAAEPLRPNEDLLRRIASLPALVACGGLPRLVVRLAAEVTWELPSLLDLQPEWLKVESVSHGTGYTGYGFRPPGPPVSRGTSRAS